MMESTQMAKQVIGFQKSIFNSGFETMSVLQDQAESLINNFMGHLPWITEDGKKRLDDTFEFTKKARNDYRKAIDDGYSRLEKLFD